MSHGDQRWMAAAHRPHRGDGERAGGEATPQAGRHDRATAVSTPGFRRSSLACSRFRPVLCRPDGLPCIPAQRMLELGIDPKHIGSSDLTHGIRHAAFNPFKRTGGGNGPVGRLTVDSGVFNPNLHSDLGKIAWMRSSPRSIRSSSGPATPRPKRRQPIRSFPSAPGPEVFFVLSEGDHDDP